MLKTFFLFSFLGFFIMPGMQFKIYAETDLPKAPDWEFRDLSLYKKLGMEFYAANWNNKYDNQTVLNSWGYKARNVDEIKDLLPEALYNIMKHPEIWGTYRINETAFIPITGEIYEAYMEDTEKYKGESYIDDDNWLRNYKSGIPFPDVDVDNDPQAGLKLVWNHLKKRNADDIFTSDTTIDLIDRGGRHKFVVSDAPRMNFDGRLFHDPKPLYKPNPNKLMYKYSTVNKQPYMVAGTIAALNRYDIPGRADDMWVYVPSLRRVRRMSTAERQDKMSGGKDFIWDSIETFSGNTSDYEFKFVECKSMLLPLCFSTVPSNVAEGYMNGVDDYWQRRKTYVIRAIPKKPVNISEMELYMDAETFQTSLSIVRDTKGRDWLFNYYGTNAGSRGEILATNVAAVDLITRHSSKSWTTKSVYAVGLSPKFFDFEELKKKYLVR